MQQEDDSDYNKYIIKNLVKMAAIKGPNIITDGLVLALDAASIRSFRGEPTTNLANTDTSRTLIRHDSGASVTFSDAPEKGDGWKKITINTRGSNFRIARFPYISHPTSTIRTYSVEVDFGTTSGYYVRIDGFAGGANTFSSGRIFTTFTTTTNNGSLALFINHNTISTSGLNDVIYYRYYQVENMPYPTAFTEGIRGTTVATGGGIADLTGTGNHGELVNAPTFNADNFGSIRFDGTNESISIAETSTLNILSYTYAFWIRRRAAQNGNFLQLLQRSTSSRNPGIWFFPNEINRIHFSIRISNNTNTSNNPGGFFLNEWHYFTATVNYNGTNTIITSYTDGLVQDSSTLSGVSPITGTGSSFIGRQLFDLANFKIYNRVLTANEVLQNYNATRRRFGL